jgi:hypothetical protein
MRLDSVVSECPVLSPLAEPDWRGEHSMDESMTDATFG